MRTRYTWWQICIIVLAIGLVIVLGAMAIRGQFGLRSPVTFRDFVSVFAVIVSWPVAIVVIALYFMTRFSNAIKIYLNGVGNIKLPGGVELQSSQNNREVEAHEPEPGSLVLSPEQQAELTATIEDIELQRSLSDEQRASLQEDFKKMADAAIQWKFSYLNLFFVQTTKNVLLWFSKAGPQTRESYELSWSPIVTDKDQRSIILNVLLQHAMLNESEGLIRIDLHGYSFLQFVGLIPPTPGAAG